MLRALFRRQPTPTPGSFSRAYLEQLGLNRQQALTLRSLSSEPGWEALLQALDRVISSRAEELLRSSEPAAFHFLRGRITGLRDVPTLVDEIVARLEDLDKQDARAVRNNAVNDDPTRVALYGTPAWTAKRAGAP